MLKDDEIAYICEGLGYYPRLKILRTLEEAPRKKMNLADLHKATNLKLKHPISFSSAQSHVRKLAECGICTLTRDEGGQYVVTLIKEVEIRVKELS